MIFDKGYDFSLWCILSTDKKNRTKIIEFIKSIPQEFLNKIRDGILQYRIYEQNNSNEEFDLYDSVSVDKETCFSFQLTDVGTLRLSKEIIDKNDSELPYNPVFEIVLEDCLGCLDKEHFDNFDEEYLGAIESDIKTTKNSITCNESEYNLIKTPFGYIVTHNDENKFIFKVSSKFINLNKMPNDLNMAVLEKIDKQKSLKKKIGK